MMTLADARDDLLSRCEVTSATIASATLLAHVITAINTAFQILWTSPFDYFRRTPFTVTTTSGVQGYALAQNLQEVVGALMLNGTLPLHRLTTKSDFQNFGPRFMGTPDPASGQPRAYYLDKVFQSAADCIAVNLLLTPTPNATFSVKFDATLDCPDFQVSDMNADPPLALPVPHEYVETFLMPLARWEITKSFYFPDESKKPLLEADMRRARLSLGLPDPDFGTTKNAVPEKATAPAPTAQSS